MIGVSFKDISRFDDLLEPIIIINLEQDEIVYYNKVCEKLKIVVPGMKPLDVENSMSSKEDYYEFRSRILEDKQECIVPNVTIATPEDANITGELYVGNVDEDWIEVYLMFKFDREDLRMTYLKNKCYDTIYSQSYSYPFRLDIANRVIYFFGPILDQFGLEPVMINYPEPVLEADVLHGEDLIAFKQMVESMYKGEKANGTFRARTATGQELWYTIEYVVNTDEDGKPIELIGEFVNVQDKVELEKQLYTDALTGCLNKASFEAFAQQALEKVGKGEKCALLIIDIDNFKAINDNLGHLFGDFVLREAGAKLKRLFRNDDLVGRIGGDEFMVLMKGVVKVDAVKERATRIVEAFDNSYKGNARSYRTTASIGIALFPENGQDFASMYSRADIALYDTKSRGKNGFTFYNPTMIEGNMSNTTPFDAAARALSQHFDQELIIDIFALLSEAKDYDVSINKVMELLGRRFNVGRCYIFEYNRDFNLFMDNTYEWCEPGVTPEIDNLQMLEKAVYGPFIERMNENGIFYCNDLGQFKGEPSFDVMDEQGIKSFLFSFNMKGDDVVNMVGFDDCKEKRVWSSIEIGTLMHASKIINQFLRYKHASIELQKVAIERLKVLDEINSYAYITDPYTHNLHYFNQEFRNNFPNAEFGDTCYKVLHNKKEPCDNCPMTKMKKLGKDKFRCIMPMISQNKKMLVNVSEIGEFNGSDSMFFSCSSIEDLDDEE